MGEYDSDPVHGLPESLPEGETILWQGAPDWKGLARRALHFWLVLLYFVGLFAWEVLSAIAGGTAAGDAVMASSSLIVPAAVVLGLIGLYARWLARSTIYTITNRRVALRFGIALPRTMNLPFTAVTSAALKVYANGTGDIPLTLTPKVRLAYLALWPHARPWRVTRAEPMLRCIPDAGRVAALLAEALRSAPSQPDSPEDAAG
ncbi:photosynthetic complex putative assembly protein PuhB [Pararhodospirillum oryzae]|uniref:Photosynthetic complex assembly protein n=1 Tax=Pararhodospirillum oryzae TaxID=478448 RepID=A0A512H4W9_9PROT|nr:photosynthetic complex putative assembly protein PuhB [Pararhodospirillum oryzae]GEO80519.1 photosynthetic complex assembly protein [Pararhodospirillum oryzae]